jgi:hypothetical protein
VNHNLNEMPEPRIEAVVELLQEMVKNKYGSELSVVYVEGGDFGAYLEAIEKIETLPINQRRATVVWVCLEDAELLRYPFFDVEFNHKNGAQKLGLTGQPEKVAEIMQLIGGQAVRGSMW